MSESAFSNLIFNEEDSNIDLNDESTIEPVVRESMPRPSLFTILIDTSEQRPYTFQNIIGDAKDDYSPILVKTKPKSLRKIGGDYSILGMESICIERKSKEDLFGSVANGAKRENFLERLRKMQSLLRFGAVVVECYKQELFDDPPSHTSLNPKTVYRTSLSWSIQFPLVHWFFCQDRDEAEQVTFRLLEKYFDHETNTKYQHKNKPIDNHLEAFKLGMISRMTANEIPAVYGKDNPLRVSWNAGLDFYSTRFLDGDRGIVYEPGETPPSEVALALSVYKSKKGKPEDGKQHKPIKGQTSFIDEVGDLIDKPQRKSK